MNPFQGTDENGNSLSEKRKEENKKNYNVSDVLSYTDIARRPPIQTDAEDDASNTEIMADKQALMLIELQQKVNAQNKMIARLEEDNEKLRKTLEAYDTDETNKSNKKRKREELNKTNNDAELEKKIETLTMKLAEKETALEETREQLSEHEWQDPSPAIQSAFFCDKMKTLIDSHMVKIEEKFAAMEEKIAVKQQADDNHPTYEGNSNIASGSKRTWANIVEDDPTKSQTPSSFRQLVMAAKNEEIADERDKQRRQNNAIIHGRTETSGNNDDEQFVDALIKEICIGNIKSTVNRIGISAEGKNRPIKVKFNDNASKVKFMNNLKNLRGKTDFAGISITDDYTLSERKMIRDFARKAKEANANEPPDCDFTWRVRGSPKNGIGLKQVMKVKRQVRETVLMN